MKQAKKLTQHDLIDNYIKQIAAHFEPIEGDQLDYRGLYELNSHLQAKLDESQNPPPEGTSDGSIDATTWNLAARVGNSLLALMCEVDAYRQRKTSR